MSELIEQISAAADAKFGFSSLPNGPQDEFLYIVIVLIVFKPPTVIQLLSVPMRIIVLLFGPKLPLGTITIMFEFTAILKISSNSDSILLFMKEAQKGETKYLYIIIVFLFN